MTVPTPQRAESDRLSTVAPGNSDDSCPLCQAKSRTAFSINDHQIQQCTTCDHRFCVPQAVTTHVQVVYDDNYFTGGGAGYDDYTAEKEMLVSSGRRYAKLISPYRMPGRLLDVGAAAGFILQGFIDSGWQGQGIEPNDTMAKLGRQNGLNIATNSLENYSNVDQPFDLVSMIQVISHFVDPRQAIETAKEMIVDDGLILIETWDRKSWTARAFGKKWHEYSPPSVLHWFTRQNLDVVMQEIGFKNIAHGRPTKWINLGHAASLIRYKMSDSAFGKIASSPLRLCPKSVKFPYFFDDVFWALYQKSN